jgi:hypothetical protein
VTAQLLYEIGGPAYLNPDVTARFDSIRLAQDGADRVRISGVLGESPPSTTKVALNYQGGFRSTTTLYLAGLDIEEKAELVERALWASVPGGRESFGSVDVSLLRTDRPDPTTNERALAQLRITVKDADEKKVGRAFTGRVTEMALSSYPGLFGAGLTAGASAYGVYWPAVVPASLVWQEVVVGLGSGGDRSVVDPVLAPDPPVVADVPAPTGTAGVIVSTGTAATTAAGVAALTSHPSAASPAGPTVRAPLGRLIGARSGDKGGNANLGVWARSDPAYLWLATFLTVTRLQELLPETAPLQVDRYKLPNLLALNFVITGLLGEGVAASTRLDGQAKSLGEWLRARVVEIPAKLLG